MKDEHRPGESGMVAITIDGAERRVPAATTVAAALLGAGTVAFRRSATGAGRGPLCGMGTCHECRVTIDGVPHVRACLVTVADGMRVTTGASATTE